MNEKLNLIENEEMLQKDKKTKTIMIVIIALIVVLLIISIVLIYLISTVQNSRLSLTIDNKSQDFASDMFIMQDDELYIDIKAFASLMNYESYNGDLKTRYSEDTTKCYISTINESASFELNSNTIYKKAANNEDYEYFELDQPVKLINNRLYVTEEGMEIGANCLINYNSSRNLIQVLSLDYLVTHYSNSFQNSAVADERADFNNKKALLHDMIVVKNSENMYGVYSVDGNEIIGTKYTSIKFTEGSLEFTVTTEEGKMGILSADGTTKIQPTYDSIKQISTELNYYLVENNEKYGVINQNGNVVVYLEYDTIGIDESRFSTNEIDNPYILFDNCIPVERNDKWGLIDINGKMILSVDYSSIGCIVGTQSNSINNNVVIIPKYEAIVIGGSNGKYGLVNSQGNMILEPALDSIYSITTSGEVKYYMTYTRQEEQDGKIVNIQETRDLEEFLDQNLGGNSQGQDTQTNTIGNETTSNTVQDANTITNQVQDTNNINTNVA